LYFTRDQKENESLEASERGLHSSGGDSDGDNESSTVPVCSLVGSFFEIFLLEKVRVIGHSKNERTFHIFYQLLAAPTAFKENLFKGFGSTTRDSFRYVGDVDTEIIDGRTDADHFEQTKSALETFGIKGEELHTLMKALCIVLLLGNLTFELDQSVDGEGALIVADDAFEKVTTLMGIGQDEMKSAITRKLVKARGEELVARLTPAQSRDSCDALANLLSSC